jgi:integrase/recombinase XerD
VSDDIYNYRRKIEQARTRITSSKVISEQNKTAILSFADYCLATGLSKPRVEHYLVRLYQVAGLFGPGPFKKATKQNIMDLVRKIEERDYAAHTKQDYKVVIKRFWKWLNGDEKCPESVRWIKIGAYKNRKLPEELLTEDEVKRAAEAAITLRDKALVLVLYESGLRVGELLTLKIKNVQMDQYGAVLIVNGKTGMRRVRIIASSPALAQWISSHPEKDNPDAWVWVSFKSRDMHHCDILGYAACAKLLRTLFEKAGIKKRCNPHIFRHSAATRYSKLMTEAQMKQHFGWVQSSEMASVYVHLSGRDVDDALLKIHGLKKDEEVEERQFRASVCPRCQEKNSPEKKICAKCGLILDAKLAIQREELEQKSLKTVSDVLEVPYVKKALSRAIKEKGLIPLVSDVMKEN